MIAALKAELRKLLSVRSTYFIILISLAIVVLFAGFGEGFRADPVRLHDAGMLASESAHAVLFVGLILAIVSLLLVGHEYRYNFIMYTLTATNRRYKVMAAKFVAITLFALLAATLVTFFAPLCSIVGAHLAHKHMVAQHFDVWQVLWRCLAVGWGYAMYAFILAAIIRNQIGAIVTYLVIPLIGENIIVAIFKWIGKYLPFQSLQGVMDGILPGERASGVTTAHNMVVAGIYIAVGLLVSTVLFVRRDAN